MSAFPQSTATFSITPQQIQRVRDVVGNNVSETDICFALSKYSGNIDEATSELMIEFETKSRNDKSHARQNKAVKSKTQNTHNAPNTTQKNKPQAQKQTKTQKAVQKTPVIVKPAQQKPVEDLESSIANAFQQKIDAKESQLKLYLELTNAALEIEREGAIKANEIQERLTELTNRRQKILENINHLDTELREDEVKYASLRQIKEEQLKKFSTLVY